MDGRAVPRQAPALGTVALMVPEELKGLMSQNLLDRSDPQFQDLLDQVQR